MGWKRGDLILTARPYAHILCHKYRRERCSFCFKIQEKVLMCTACQVLGYCGRDCQRADWEVHKVECQCLKRSAPNVPTDSVMLMLRLVIKQQLGKHNKPMDGDPTQRHFQQLMSHMEEIKQDAERCKTFGDMTFTLSLLLGQGQFQKMGTGTYMQIFGQMVINTFSITDEELRDVGSGIFLSASVLDHRCSPNAVVTFRGTTLNLRAVEDIPDGNAAQLSEAVFINYVDQLAPSWERQAQLKRQYYFHCHCSRCLHTSLDEVMTSGKESLAEEELQCKRMVDKKDQLKANCANPKELVERLRLCITRVESSLSTTNIYKLRLLDFAFDTAVDAAQWDDALKFGLPTLQSYKELLPPFTPTLGLQLMRVGKIQLYLEQLDQARATLAEAERIIAVTHGKDSELHSCLVQLLQQTTLDVGQLALE